MAGPENVRYRPVAGGNRHVARGERGNGKAAETDFVTMPNLENVASAMSTTSRRAVLAVGAASLAATLPATASDALELAGPAVFDEIWQTVQQHFFDPRLNGLDWPAVRSRYRPALLTAGSPDARAAVINAMLAELHSSHTEYLLPNQPAYYQLADIFLDLRRPELQAFFTAGEVTYPGIGISTQSGEQGRTFVTSVIDGQPAAHAGVLVGDEIIAVDDAPFRSVDSFHGKIGATVTLAIRRAASGPVFGLPVVPQALHPNEMFLRGMEASARILRAPNGARIGYVHVWSYAGFVYQRVLERLIGTGILRNADALIWDLRDGWGGAVPEYLDLFDQRRPTVELIGRNGGIRLEAVTWRKPVAMLINSGTRSGKEILAYGFKKYQVGSLIGTRTMGAVLAATVFMMRDGSMLLLAVDDVRVDNVRLEGIGVAPTIPVPFTIDYAGGADPQLSRAVEVLSAGRPARNPSYR
jgi:carboxyl-terminal processing protease